MRNLSKLFMAPALAGALGAGALAFTAVPAAAQFHGHFRSGHVRVGVHSGFHNRVVVRDRFRRFHGNRFRVGIGFYGGYPYYGYPSYYPYDDGYYSGSYGCDDPYSPYYDPYYCGY